MCVCVSEGSGYLYCRTEIRALFSFTGSSVPGNYVGENKTLSSMTGSINFTFLARSMKIGFGDSTTHQLPQASDIPDKTMPRKCFPTKTTPSTYKITFFSLLQVFHVLQGTENSTVFQTQSYIAHFARPWRGLTFYPPQGRHHILAFGYQQLLAKLQGKPKLLLRSWIIFSII